MKNPWNTKPNHSNFYPLQQANFSPIEVRITGSFEEGYKRFKSLFQKERIVSQLKEHETYEKSSQKKRRKRREAQQRRLITESREQMMKSGEWDKRQKQKAVKRQKKLEKKLREQQRSEDL